MKIDQLTIGEAKHIAALFGQPQQTPTINNGMIGKYVIVRCRDAGVHCGYLESHNGRECVLTKSRRLWYWKPANGAKFLSGLAMQGHDPSSKISCTVERIHLTENCEIIECSTEAESKLKNARDDEN